MARTAIFAALLVEVGTPVEVGDTASGLQRLIPSLGGRAGIWYALSRPDAAWMHELKLIATPTLVQLDARNFKAFVNRSRLMKGLMLSTFGAGTLLHFRPHKLGDTLKF